MPIEHIFRQAIQRHQAGQLREAESLCRRLIAMQSDHADGFHMLAIIRRQSGDNATAAELIHRALAIDRCCADANYNLGNVLRDQGLLDEAMAAYRRSISLGQNVPQSYHNLGCLMREKGMMEEASIAFGQEDQAIAIARQGGSIKPEAALKWYNLGNSLGEQRRFPEAIAAYRRAIAICPDFAEAHCNLGSALVEENQPDTAIAAYRQSIDLNPSLAQAHFNLAKVLYDKGQLEEAIIANRQAIALRPGYAEAYRNLASNLFEAGQLDEAIATYRKGLGDDKAANARIDSDLIYTLHFHPAYDARSIDQAANRWNRQYAEPLAGQIQTHRIDVARRRLRIGYVSSDFRSHVVGANLRPLFEKHNHDEFEIICYGDVTRPDAMTRWFQQHADRWCDTCGLSDEQLAQQVRDDRVDILVDLSLHTQGNRLLMFARKPAPVQVTFAAYPGSTGLTAIDYRLSDPYLDPPGMDESVYSEKTIRLPNSFWCYDPQDCCDVSVSPLPALGSGIVTFGCLSNFCKINLAVLDLWTGVMNQVEGSRLIILAKHGSHRQRTIDHLSQRGIDPRRIEIISYRPRRDYLKQYHRIDIGLDTFPYNGHTTSLDSFWMGVPVVTLMGQTAVSRAGWCQLSNLGLPGLAGQTAEQFVRIAMDLAKDLPKLQQLRSELRGRMERSTLMDGVKFARDIEAAYRMMWQQMPRS